MSTVAAASRVSTSPRSTHGCTASDCGWPGASIDIPVDTPLAQPSMQLDRGYDWVKTRALGSPQCVRPPAGWRCSARSPLRRRRRPGNGEPRSRSGRSGRPAARRGDGDSAVTPRRGQARRAAAPSRARTGRRLSSRRSRRARGSSPRRASPGQGRSSTAHVRAAGHPLELRPSTSNRAAAPCGHARVRDGDDPGCGLRRR